MRKLFIVRQISFTHFTWLGACFFLIIKGLLFEEKCYSIYAPFKSSESWQFSHWHTIQEKHHENWFSFAKIIYTCTNVTDTFLVFDANINNFCSTTWCYG